MPDGSFDQNINVLGQHKLCNILNKDNFEQYVANLIQKCPFDDDVSGYVILILGHGIIMSEYDFKI